MPVRTQITRHDCVEGWSCIGKWTGVPLSELLDQVRLKPEANDVVEQSLKERFVLHEDGLARLPG